MFDKHWFLSTVLEKSKGWAWTSVTIGTGAKKASAHHVVHLVALALEEEGVEERGYDTPPGLSIQKKQLRA